MQLFGHIFFVFFFACSFASAISCQDWMDSFENEPDGASIPKIEIEDPDGSASGIILSGSVHSTPHVRKHGDWFEDGLTQSEITEMKNAVQNEMMAVVRDPEAVFVDIAGGDFTVRRDKTGHIVEVIAHEVLVGKPVDRAKTLNKLEKRLLLLDSERDDLLGLLTFRSATRAGYLEASGQSATRSDGLLRSTIEKLESEQFLDEAEVEFLRTLLKN